MMLYLLEMIMVLDRGYDYYEAKLVRAKSEDEARKIANEIVGDEGKIWEDKELVACKIIKKMGNSEVIISSFRGG
jgi:hypothetical protein